MGLKIMINKSKAVFNNRKIFNINSMTNWEQRNCKKGIKNEYLKKQC